VCVSTAAPVWVLRPQDSHLEEGKPGYLHCHAQANPEPEVTWLRNNIMLTPEVGYQKPKHHTDESVFLSWTIFEFPQTFKTVLHMYMPTQLENNIAIYRNTIVITITIVQMKKIQSHSHSSNCYYSPSYKVVGNPCRLFGS